MRIWTIVPKDTIKRLHMDFVDFKGGSQTTKRNIPAQSADEASLQSGLMGYVLPGIKQSANLQNQANTAIGNTYNPNYTDLAGNYNTTMGNVNSGFTGLLNGEVPQSYMDSMTSKIGRTLDDTMGKNLNRWANSGVINSSVSTAGIKDASQAVANTASDNLLNYINNQAGLLNNQATQAGNTLNNNAAAQQASYFQPTQLNSYAQSAYSPAANLFNTFYNGRMGTGSTTTSQSDGGSGVWSAVGSIGSALICFAGGTKIATPDGDRLIEDIQEGMKVYSLDRNGDICVETVEFVNPPHESPVWEVLTDKGIIKPTESQRFLTNNGFEYVEDIQDEIVAIDGYAQIKGMELKPAEMVYDFTVSGRNIFFANGLAAEGWD